MTGGGFLDPLGAVKRRVLAGIGIGALLLIMGLLVWAMRLDGLRAGYKAALEELRNQADTVLIAIQGASDNPKLKWENAAAQVDALGQSRRSLASSVKAQNQSIDDMAKEAVRLRARAAELRQIADRAEAQRRVALGKLSDMAITPGTRSDCMQLLREAEDALDIVYRAGV